jgi:hypothetical protein
MRPSITFLAMLSALTFATAAHALSQGDETRAPESAIEIAGNDVAKTPVRLKAEELKEHPFKISAIELTILDFNEKVIVSWAFSTYHSPGVGGITVKVANTTNDFLTFSPARLIIVGADGNQATVAMDQNTGIRAPAETQLGPGGRFETKYILTAGVTLPARIYYDQKLLAEITD